MERPLRLICQRRSMTCQRGQCWQVDENSVTPAKVFARVTTNSLRPPLPHIFPPSLLPSPPPLSLRLQAHASGTGKSVLINHKKIITGQEYLFIYVCIRVRVYAYTEYGRRFKNRCLMDFVRVCLMDFARYVNDSIFVHTRLKEEGL